MSQPVNVQRNDFSGAINNFGGTTVAGAAVNSRGGDIFIGSPSAGKGAPYLLEGEAIYVPSLGIYKLFHAATHSSFHHSLYHQRSQMWTVLVLSELSSL
jgi:hypothetical protein